MNDIKYASNKGYYVNVDGILFNPKGKELNPYKTKTGYFISGFRIEGKVKNLPIHRLQAYQKFGDKMFEEGIIVRHLNGKPEDNSFKNIDIGASQEIRYSMTNRLYNHEDIVRDKKLGLTYSEIMSKYNISSKGTISFIINKSLESLR